MHLPKIPETMGPYRFANNLITIPKIDLRTYIIYIIIYIAALPIINQILRYFNLPSYALYLLYTIYFLIMFYMFGVVTIGYILFINAKNIATDIQSETHVFKHLNISNQ